MSSTKAILAVLLLASCSSEVPEPTGKTKDLAAASTTFAFTLHGEVLRQNEGKNVFISPASVLFALSMAASGAAGETRDEMLAGLGLKGWKTDDLDAACGTLLRWLEKGEAGVELDVANSAWLRQGVPFHAAYGNRLEDAYNAKAEVIDFNSPKALEKINDWVKDRTRGKISNAGPNAIQPLDVLFLINAVYFKGAWKKKFEKSQTREQPFHLSNGKSKTLKFMRRTGHYEYAEAEGYQALRIPYGEKDRIALYVFLPKEGVTLGRLQDQLASLGPKWRMGLDGNSVEVELPRFTLEFGTALKPVLMALGMKQAFGKQADFSGMSPMGKEVLISEIHHKAFVDVNEEGTEAAAVTTVGVAAKSAAPMKPIVFKVDRPFFCAIVDDTTGAILFTGSIVDP